MVGQITAYVLMKIEIGSTEDVVDKLRLIEKANKIAVTTGEFDVIVRLEVDTLEELYDITVRKIHSIRGIKETTTAVVEKMVISP